METPDVRNTCEVNSLDMMRMTEELWIGPRLGEQVMPGVGMGIWWAEQRF